MSPNWSKVVESLQERRLIPILGGDALPVVHNGKTAPLNEFLAEELATRLTRAGLAVPTPVPPTLQGLIRAIFDLPINEERARSLITGPLREHLTAAHREILGQIKPAPETAALQIFSGLPLLITTTIDGAASLALKEACGEEPRVLNRKRITTTTLEDLPEGWNAMQGRGTPPFLYHLFGRIEGQETFALTDDEMIEYFWKLQGSDTTRRLRDAFADGDILLLGCAFPDWLLRFVLRLARGRAFTEAATFNLVAEKQLIEAQASYDRSLHGFLRQFQASNVWVYREDPVQFLARLAAQLPVADTPPQQSRSSSLPLRQKKGNIFLSYTTANVDVARRLAEEIGKRCPVWFDDKVIQGGEELSSEIVRAIQDAHLFVPLISRATNTAATSRVFVSEWKKAIEVASNVQLGLRPYIIPVIIDDLPYKELAGEAKKFTEQKLDLSFRYLLPRPPEKDAAAAFTKLLDDIQASYQKVELALAGQPVANP